MNEQKQKHTPGPWYTRHGQISSETSTHGCTIADCNATANGISDKEVEANARLIAAAPDLLAALEECITSEGAACFGDIENHPELMQRRLYAIADIAREAIKKAQGAA